MISIKNIKTSTAKMTDRSVVASACSLGLAASASSALFGTGLSGAGLPLGMTGLLMDRPERSERPTKALEAGVEGKAKAAAYGFAATGAGIRTTTQQHHTMWAFRGLEPWSDPA